METLEKSNTPYLFKRLLPWGNMSFEKWMQFCKIAGFGCIKNLESVHFISIGLLEINALTYSCIVLKKLQE